MANIFGIPEGTGFTAAPNTATENGGLAGTLLNPYFSKALDLFFYVAGVAAVVYVVWAAIRMIQSKGDSKKFQEGRSHLINAVIGIVIVVSAYLIISIGLGLGKDVSKLPSGAISFPTPTTSNSGGSDSCRCGYRIVTDSHTGATSCELDPTVDINQCP